MNEEEYFQRRIDDQMQWFESKSTHNQTRYRQLRTLELVVAAFVPVLAAFSDMSVAVRIATALSGAAVVIFAGLLSINRYQENWIQYRATAETLKRETFLYKTRSGPYKTDESKEPFRTLVARVEGVLSEERDAWKDSMGQETSTQE